jgi:hypothetical protein
MKQLKIIVAFVAGLFSFTSVQAGELTVTGTMQATYQSEVDNLTSNPLGMNTDLKFSGSTDTDFGTATWSMATDGTFLGGATGNVNGNDHSLKLATSYGTFGLGNTGDAANAVDDITPSAFEEANGSGSGTYSTDLGSGMEGSMSLSYGNADIYGTGVSVAYNYYPKLDATTNNEKSASADSGVHNYKRSQTINVGIPVAGLPIVGDSLVGGMKITLGYEKTANTLSTIQAKEGGTVAIVLPVGPLSVGIQKKAYSPMGTTLATDTVYRDDIYGIAYAINDDLALSYNLYESDQNNGDETANQEQTTKAINLAYTIGGLTLGFQDAKTSHAGYVKDTDNDTRTISIKTAF